MNSPEGMPINAEALVLSEGLRTLGVLSGLAEPLFQRGLEGPWLEVVRTERRRRQDDLEELRTHRPASTEMPPYDDANPQTYFEQARATNRTATQLSDREKMRREVTMAQRAAREYVAAPDVRTRLRGPNHSVNFDRLADFFATNLYGVVGTARSVALRKYEMQRNATIRQHFAGMNLSSRSSLASWAQGQEITSNQIEAARQEILIDTPPYQAPYPDFFQLTTEQQETIIQTLGKEWEELCLLVHESSPAILAMEVTHAQAPLAYLPVRALKDALAANPALDAASICYAFIRTPQSFQERLEKLKTDHKITEMMRKIGITATKPKPEPASEPLRLVPAESTGQPIESEYLRYDHAQITVRNPATGEERAFLLATDRANSVLAVRILRVLAQTNEGDQVDGDRLSRDLWSAMPDSERKLFLPKGGSLQKQWKPYVLGVLRTLTSKLGITRETSGESFKLERRPSVSLERSPPSTEAMRALIPIFPPGTTRERINEFAGDVLPQAYITMAEDILRNRIDSAGRTAPLAEIEALHLLSFITDRNGKRSLFVLLEKAQATAGGPSTGEVLEQVLAQLHNQIRQSLGEAYEGAHRARMIGGNHALGDRQVGLVSGRLPTSTKSDITGQWHIGVPRR